jgi:hypothetical protein
MIRLPSLVLHHTARWGRGFNSPPKPLLGTVPVLDAVVKLVGTPVAAVLWVVSCAVLCLALPPIVILIFSPSFSVGMCVNAGNGSKNMRY